MRRALFLLPLLALACSQADARKSNKYDAIDSCLRAGGAWNYRGDQCQASDPGPVDSIYIDKSDHWMTVYRGGRIVREFRVSLGRGGLAPKQRRGDHRVPEGAYLIAGHNPRSAYHLSLRIGYPTVEQIAAAQAIGTEAGGDIMIHGLPNGDGDVGSRQQRIDWTDGCIALTDPEIDWLYRAVPDGTPVRIVP